MNTSGIRHSRPRTTALAASAFISLAALTACGGGSSDSDNSTGEPAPSTSASAAQESTAPAVKPLTAAELDKASLTKADLSGYQVSTASKTDAAAMEAVEVSGEECEPLGRAVAGAAVGESTAIAQRRVTGGTGTTSSSDATALDLNTGMVTLASYASAEDATAALKSATDAVTACTGGFDWTVGGEKLQASKVTKGTAPESGEEALAFTVVTSLDGVDAPWKVVVFRDGATLAHFSVANTAAMISGKDFTFPADLVTAQAEKLA